MAALSSQFLLSFTPEQWTPARRLRVFLGPPYPSSRHLLNAISAADSHRHKVHIFRSLLASLRDGLVADADEVELTGYTTAARAKQYSAIAETIILELYSCLDGLRTTLYFAYQGVRGVQNRSTDKLFRLAKEKAYDRAFPEPIRGSLAAAYESWFPELRRLRVELAHGDVGHCHLDPSSELVTYMHVGLGTETRALVVEDFEAKLDSLVSSVLPLLDGSFAYLSSRLAPTERRAICGIYQGRMYERDVVHEAGLTRQSGRCYSRKWFESEPGLECPIRATCEAYAR